MILHCLKHCVAALLQVVVVAAICEFLGAVLLGASVTSTIKCDSIHIQSTNCVWIRVVLDKTPHSGIGRALRGPTSCKTLECMTEMRPRSSPDVPLSH